MDDTLRAVADQVGAGAELIEIPTADPVNFHQAITAGDRCRTLAIGAVLALPGDAAPHDAAPHPVVMVVPGSAGISPNHVMHAQTLLGEGYGVCLLDPFGARSVTSTVANQAQYSFAASAYDVLAALRVLAADPRIDAGRISAQGHSRGGAAALVAAMRPLADAVVGDLALAGAYAAYPWCGQQFLRPDAGRTRVRAIIGDQDQWCSVMAVQAQIQAIRLAGGDATMRLVAGAHHSFDRYEDVHSLDEARVSPNAPIEYLADDGSMIDPATGEPDPARTDIDQFRAAVASGFGQRGASLGSTTGQPELFRTDMLAFHAAVLR